MTMASMQTISKLHQQAPERAPVKTANLADLQPEAPTLLELAERTWAQPLHRRFHSPRRSRNDSPALMNSVPPSVPADRSDAFARLAARSPCGSRGCWPLADAAGPRRRHRSSRRRADSDFDRACSRRGNLGRLGARYCRQWLGRASPSIFCFALLAFGARKRRAFFVVVTRCDRAGRSISLSARFDVNAMTATLKQSQTPTDFDWAVFSAVAAGWTGRPAFDAVCCMLASGMTASQIEKAFNDARTRIQ